MPCKVHLGAACCFHKVLNRLVTHGICAYDLRDFFLVMRGAYEFSIGGRVYAVKAGSGDAGESDEHVNFFGARLTQLLNDDFGGVPTDHAVLTYDDAFTRH